MSILTQRLSAKAFIISQLIILLLGVIFLVAVYYILNIQHQSTAGSTLSQGPVTTRPSLLFLDITSPEDNLLTFQPQVLISGKTAPNLTVLINLTDKNQVIESTSDGTFSTLSNLNEGPNKISILVFSQSGEEKKATRTIFYSREKI